MTRLRPREPVRVPTRDEALRAAAVELVKIRAAIAARRAAAAAERQQAKPA